MTAKATRYFAALAVAATLSTVSAAAMPQADAAKIMAQQLGIQTNSEREKIWGMWPSIWPGGYETTFDIAYPEKTATYETAIVSIVRWAGWDTVAYDRTHFDEIKKYASPEGFPHYKHSPSPRSIPYIAAAISAGLIAPGDVVNLQKPIDANAIKALATRAAQIKQTSKSVAAAPSIAATGVEYPTNEARLAVLKPGFHDYGKFDGTSTRILDLGGPEIRLFTPGSQMAGGKQNYFPLGPLETLFSVGLNVEASNLSHQSQAIYGIVDNRSSTVNAVGIWGTGKSWARDARTWGGFFVGETAHGAEHDAQIVGIEIDVINNAAPGNAPHASKDGLQIVGIGSQPVTNAINIIGVENGRWANGLLFTAGSIQEGGAYIGMAPGQNVARGIDMAGVRFTDSAIALGKWSAITFQNQEGEKAAILTDDSNHLIVRTGSAGLRIVNDKSELIAEITADGDIVTPSGSLRELERRVTALERKR